MRAVIRNANKRDLDIIDDIYCVNAIEEQNNRFSRTSYDEIKKDFKKHEASRKKYFLKNMISRKVVFVVVEVEDEIVGFGEGFTKKYFNGSAGIVDKIYINKGFRKMRIGFKLSKYIMKELKNIGVDFFEWRCYTCNTGSIKLARKLGMEDFSIVYRKYL